MSYRRERGRFMVVLLAFHTENVYQRKSKINRKRVILMLWEALIDKTRRQAALESHTEVTAELKGEQLRLFTFSERGR